MGQPGVETVESVFEPIHVRLAHDRVAGDRKLAAEIEKIVLDVVDASPNGFRQLVRQQHAERAVQFVDRADSFDARRVLRDARTVGESRGAGVARARVNPGEAVAHGISNYSGGPVPVRGRYKM